MVIESCTHVLFMCYYVVQHVADAADTPPPQGADSVWHQHNTVPPHSVFVLSFFSQGARAARLGRVVAHTNEKDGVRSLIACCNAGRA